MVFKGSLRTQITPWLYESYAYIHYYKHSKNVRCWRATNENKCHTKDHQGEHQLMKQFVSFLFHVIISYLTYNHNFLWSTRRQLFAFLVADMTHLHAATSKTVLFSLSYHTAAACKSDPHDLSHAGHIAVQVYEDIWGIVFNLFLNQVIPKI